jgi:plasmid stabilization system protein ParE
MKRRVTYHPKALTELAEIAAYTRRTWGGMQAKRYLAALVTDIRALRTSAKRYPHFDQVYPGLRRKRSAMHHIYYLTSDDRIEIIRIIHVQRDPGLNLKVEP